MVHYASALTRPAAVAHSSGTINAFFTPYLSYPNFDWTTCIQNNNCDSKNGMAQHTQGGMALRIAQLHGAASVKAAIKFLSNAISSRRLSASAMTVSAKNNLLIESFAQGAKADLSCYMVTWKWPIDPALRDQLATLYGPNSNCADQDKDGYTPLQGDLDDRNPAVHPGALEVVNGIDDDCDGIVDDILVEESSDFPGTLASAVVVPFPARIRGSITSPQDADSFKFTLPSASRVRFALQSLDAFRGWVFLYMPNSSEWLQYAYVGPAGATSQTDVDLPAGTWAFSVEASDSYSTPGKYQLLVYPTTPWPSGLTAPNPGNSSQGVESFATPPLPIDLRGKAGLTARFWVEGFGWVGSVPLDSAGSATMTWSPPSAMTTCSVAYRVQFLSGDLPVSPTSQPAYFLPYNATCLDAAGNAPPRITGVLNRASLDNRLAPGGVAIVSGSNFGSSTAIGATVGAKKTAVLSATPTQLVIQMPADAVAGATSLRIGASAPFYITLAQYAPALVSQDGSGKGIAAAFHQQNNAAVSASLPAKAAERIVIYAENLGPTLPVVAAGALSPALAVTALQPSLTVAGQPAAITFSGLVPGRVGTFQVDFQVPAAVPPGNQPVLLTLGGASSNAVVLPIGQTPRISAVLNGASFAAGAPIAPGSFASLFGSDFGSSDQLTGFPATSFNGVSVTFNGIRAPLFHLIGSQGQINLLVPTELSETGIVSVVVTAPDGASPAFALLMSPAAPGVFAIPSVANPKRHTAVALFAGTAWRAMPDALARELGIPGDCLAGVDPAIICGQPARPGDVLQLYVTGLGKATPNGIAAGVPLATGVVAPADGSPLYITVLQPQVTIGGIPAEVFFSGVAPGFAGLYQINLRIPESAPSGDDVPLRITMPNGQTDARASIAIR